MCKRKSDKSDNRADPVGQHMVPLLVNHNHYNFQEKNEACT